MMISSLNGTHFSTKILTIVLKNKPINTLLDTIKISFSGKN